ncbi:UPF0280 family protein [Variovorax sp. HJSM1_2]|uniref:UPF0280 family protein n=1 Tax=Variovorax sp. HJSM1_2 TaxID=3366263 RepID=UPI003BBF3853
MTAQRTQLPDGRWHFQHGPIDIVIGANAAVGYENLLTAAHARAWTRFQSILTELVAELPLLRQAVAEVCPLQGVVAQRMWQACAPFAAHFITPMAAVAGAVAQELLPFYQVAGMQRAWINNGGDIALHLAPGQSVQVGLFADLGRLVSEQPLQLDGRFQVHADMRVRGIATSGWRGRSLSMGIADSVTVLARSAAQADAAATIIANAVNIENAAIERLPANQVRDDSDLGERLVTVHVPPLPVEQVHAALQHGLRRAEALWHAGHIEAAVLVCQGKCVTTELPARVPTPPRLARQFGALAMSR